jgi:hypothetical protein
LLVPGFDIVMPFRFHDAAASADGCRRLAARRYLRRR